MSDLSIVGQIIAQMANTTCGTDSDHTDRALAAHLGELAEYNIPTTDGTRVPINKIFVQARAPNLLDNVDANKNILKNPIRPGAAKALLRFFWYQPMNVTSFEDAIDLLKVARFEIVLELTQMAVESCVECLTPINCLQAWTSPLKHLEMACVPYVLYNFYSAYVKYESVREEFYKVGIEKVQTLLSDRLLNVPTESALWSVMVDWMRANNSINAKTASTLMQCLRSTPHNELAIVRMLLDFSITHKVLMIERPKQRPRRVPRDVLVVMCLYDKKTTIAYALDREAKELRRMHTIDYKETCVPVPTFVSTQDCLFQVGGTTSNLLGFPKADVFQLSLGPLKWERVASIPIERAFTAVCAAPDGRIFLAGGHSQSPRSRMNTVDCYFPTENTWKQLPRLQMGRYKAASVFVDGRLFVVGGSSHDTPLRHCEYLPKMADVWSVIAPLNIPRTALALVAYRDALYAIGGSNMEKDLRSVEKYPLPHSNSWQMAPKMITRRANVVAEVFDDKIFVLGGEHAGPLTCEFFDGTSWQFFCMLPCDVTPLAALHWTHVPEAATMPLVVDHYLTKLRSGLLGEEPMD